MSNNNDDECLNIINKKNYYEILGVDKNATDDVIKKAYRKLAIKFHPDKNKAKHAEEAFKKVNQAFTVLSDKSKRKNYDLFGNENLDGNMSFNGGQFNSDFNPFDVFNAFFGGNSPFDIFDNLERGGHAGGTAFSFGNGGFKVYTTGFGQPFGARNNGFAEGGGFDPFDILFNGGRPRQVHRVRNNQNEGILSTILGYLPIILIIFWFILPLLRAL